MSEDQNPIPTTYVYTVYLFTKRRRGGGETLTREKVGAAVHIAGPKIPT